MNVWPLLVAALLMLVSGASTPLPSEGAAGGRVTTPKEQFGANFGDDFFLANCKQISEYWRKLERESRITSPRTNDSYTAVNRVLKAKERVVRLTDTVTLNGKKFPPGAGYVTVGKSTVAAMQEISSSLGLNFDGVKTAAPVSGKPMHAVCVACGTTTVAR